MIASLTDFQFRQQQILKLTSAPFGEEFCLLSLGPFCKVRCTSDRQAPAADTVGVDRSAPNRHRQWRTGTFNGGVGDGGSTAEQRQD